MMVIEDLDTEFHDALEEFPFVDASSFFESEQSLLSSELDSSNHTEATVSILSEQSPDSPSSPSSAGLRYRRRSDKGLFQSQFFKNNPDGLIDFDLHGAFVSPEKKYEPSDGNDETDASSSITSVNGDEHSTSDSPNSGTYFIFTLAELVIKAVSFQSKFFASSITSPIRIIYYSYMLVTDPFGIKRYVRNYMLENVWGICYSGIIWIVHQLTDKNTSTWKWCFRVGWGLLWLSYCGFILICLSIPAFLVSGLIVKCIVEEPVRITNKLNFDYSRDTPTAFVPIISCPDSSSLELSEKSTRVIPFDHELQATVSLTLPESDYNRNLGIFQVRVEFLSRDGKPLSSTSQPCMLQFKSESIRLVSTFLYLAPLLTGYSSETQTLDIKFKGYTEKETPTSCSRVVLEKRAEFTKGGGVPELYAASIKLESQLPFLKKMLWYSKGIIFLWISFMIFMVELLFTLLCCTPVIFPWLRHSSGSSNDDANRNNPSG